MVKRIKRFIAAIAIFVLIAGVAIPSIGKSYAATKIVYDANRYQESYHLGKYSVSKKQEVQAIGGLTNPTVKTVLINKVGTEAVGNAYISAIVYSTGYVAFQKGSPSTILKKKEDTVTISLTRHPDNASLYYEHKGVMRNETTTINVSQRKDIVNY